MPKIVLITFLVILFSLSCVSIKSQPTEITSEPKALAEKVDQLEKEGRYEEAIPYAKRLLKIVEKELPKEENIIAIILNGLANLYQATGRYAEAEPLYKRSLEITERVLGKDHPDVAASLNNLAMVYQTTGRYTEAEPLYKRSLEIREKALGKDHPDVAQSLHNLALVHQATGRYAEAEPLYKRSLEIRERVLGKNHPDVAWSLNNLAMIYGVTGRYVEAEPLYKRSLEIREKVFGKEHRDVAWSLNNLAMVYGVTGRYAEAEPLYKRSAEIKEKLLGKDHPDVAQSLSSLAWIYQTTERYAEAESLYKRSVEIFEKAYGQEHPTVATSLGNLALVYGITGRSAEAEILCKRSLKIRERTLGKEHPDVAWSLNSLGAFYYDTGRYAEAEHLYKRSLEIFEKAYGKEHSSIGAGLYSLANLYQAAGRNADAEPLYKRSLEIREKVLGKDHPDVAANLNELASIYLVTGRFAEAEPLFERSLKIREKVFGNENLNVAASLNNLALIYKNTGRYAEAESLYKRSLEIIEKLLGKDHVDVARSLSNLAWIFAKTGRFAEAESLLLRSLTIREKELGKDHPFLAASLNELAVIYWRTGRYSEAESLLKRTIDILESKVGKEGLDPAILINIGAVYSDIGDQLEGHRMLIRGLTAEETQRENTFLMLSERQKLNYMEQKKWMIHGLLTHTLGMQGDDHAVRETFEVWLKWKGAVMEVQRRYVEATAQSDNPEIKEKFKEYTDIRREIARLQVAGPGKTDSEEHRRKLDGLKERKESIEVELNKLSRAFALEKMITKADTKKISEILIKNGEGCAYVDFARINLYNPKEKKFSGAAYLVFLLLPRKEFVVKLVNMGHAETIDGRVRAYLEEMKRAREFGEVPRERILKAEAKALYELLLKPIEKQIKGKKHLYISPDGNLNLIPFEVLMTPEGKYLTEEYNITYIAAGRDIMRFMDEAVAKGEPIIMADPDYDMGSEEKTKVAQAIGVLETRSAGLISRDAKDLKFKRLPDTKTEANAIEKTLKESYKTDIRNYQDKRALEEVLLTVKEPKILHLATHGYFLKDEEVKHHQTLGFLLLDREVIADLMTENLMLRSGIVLAGANASLKEGRDDGIVSAEKVLGLRLKGTDLVVLSACNTGTGEVKSGEGVFGLKRSFILSGAKTVVMSLWSIPSKETTELMTHFYTLMAKGKSKSEALREARLNLMKKKANPFYWGAFIMVGNPN